MFLFWLGTVATMLGFGRIPLVILVILAVQQADTVVLVDFTRVTAADWFVVNDGACLPMRTGSPVRSLASTAVGLPSDSQVDGGDLD